MEREPYYDDCDHFFVDGECIYCGKQADRDCALINEPEYYGDR